MTSSGEGVLHLTLLRRHRPSYRFSKMIVDLVDSDDDVIVVDEDNDDVVAVNSRYVPLPRKLSSVLIMLNHLSQTFVVPAVMKPTGRVKESSPTRRLIRQVPVYQQVLRTAGCRYDTSRSSYLSLLRPLISLHVPYSTKGFRRELTQFS